MVNVTKTNFREVSDEFLKLLPSASYVALDEEMTGISLPGGGGIRRMPKDDTVEERFQRLKAIPERYSIIQVGVALFHENPKFSTKPSAMDQSPSSATQGGANSSSHSNNPSDTQPAPEPEFIARPYNFYIFPGSAASDRDVTLSPAAIHFLNQHGMDFSLWTQQGVPYVSRTKAQLLRARFYEKYPEEQPTQTPDKNQENNDSHATSHGHSCAPNTQMSAPMTRKKLELTRPADIEFVARAMASLREWIDSGDGSRSHAQPNNHVNNHANAHPNPPLPNPAADEPNGVANLWANANANVNVHNSNNTSTLARSTTEFVLPPCNSYLRRALYETVEATYPSLTLERGEGPHRRNCIVVLRMTPEERRLRREAKKHKDLEELKMQLGFFRIFEALSQANRGELKPMLSKCTTQNIEVSKSRKIPLVVHNGFMDALFLLTHFHSVLLPATWMQTKALIHDYFPLIFDTKCLAEEYSLTHYDSTALSELFAWYRDRPLLSRGTGVELAPEFREGYVSSNTNPEGNATSGTVETETTNANPDSNAMVGQGVDVTSAASAAATNAHEAAYDAYMTGSVFYALCKSILCQQSAEGRVDENHVLSSVSFLGQSKGAPKYGQNKLHFMRSLYTIDLNSPKSDPLRRGLHARAMFRVSGIDTAVSTRDILRAITAGVPSGADEGARDFLAVSEGALANIGGGGSYPAAGYEIVWVDDDTFYVGARSDRFIVEDNNNLGGVSTSSSRTNKRYFEAAERLHRALADRFPQQTIVSLKAHLTSKDEEQRRLLLGKSCNSDGSGLGRMVARVFGAAGQGRQKRKLNFASLVTGVQGYFGLDTKRIRVDDGFHDEDVSD